MFAQSRTIGGRCVGVVVDLERRRHGTTKQCWVSGVGSNEITIVARIVVAGLISLGHRFDDNDRNPLKNRKRPRGEKIPVQHTF